ncbi:MAG: transporter, partial [Oleiharenicola lentus]
EYDLPNLKGLAFSLGLRNEGVVAHDLFGGSLGFRRPGFIVSVEPGVIYSKGRYSGTLTVPIAIHRNRVTSYGATKAGDAAFADYTINLSFTINL